MHEAISAAILRTLPSPFTTPVARSRRSSFWSASRVASLRANYRASFAQFLFGDTNERTEPAPAQQKPAPVTTTVIVHGEVEDNYLPESVTAGTLTNIPIKNVPLAISVVDARPAQRPGFATGSPT